MGLFSLLRMPFTSLKLKFFFCFDIVVVVINSNLFELIHLDKNMKTKETKDQTCWFLKIFFQYTQNNTASITWAMNILPCKPP